MTVPGLFNAVRARAFRWRVLGLLLLPLAGGAIHAPGDVTLERVAGGFTAPVYVIGDPTEPDHLLVVELRGRITLLVNGVPAKKPFLNITQRVAVGTNEDEEYGLFSMAFDPRGTKQRFVYVNYTNLDGDTVISRFKMNKARTRARAGTEKVLLKVVQPQTWHNGGQLQVGPDKHLYVGMGDGGDDFDSGAAGQDLTQLLGKLLRFQVTNRKLKVPKDNPVLPGVGLTAIWAIGLRNPWRFSFDRTTGDLLIGDVGENSREEIDFEKAGSEGGTNYGWPVREGGLPYNGSVAPATDPLTGPIHEYDHSQGQSVTGGYVYRGNAIPDLVGYYLFADWSSSRIWAFRLEDGEAKGVTELSDVLVNENGDTPTVVSFGEDSEGELYLCDFYAGVIYRLVPAG